MLTRLRFRVALCLLVFAAAAASADSPDKPALRLGSDVWPPFTDVAGKPRVATDLVHQALERAGISATSEVRADFAGLIERIRAGELDGSAAVWRTAEREAFLRYSKPYLENRLVLVGRRGSDLRATSFGELTGRRVGVVGSYAYGEVVDGAHGPVFVEGPNDGANLQRLLRGEVDYVLVDELVALHLFERGEAEAKQLLERGPVPIVKRSLHFAVRRDLAGSQAIVARFDEEIRKMMADGSYNRVLQLDWIAVDVDGDGNRDMVLDGAHAGLMPPGSSYQLFGSGDSEDPEGRWLGVRYIVNGQAYGGWEDVPAEYKVPSKRGLDPARTGIVLFEF